MKVTKTNDIEMPRKVAAHYIRRSPNTLATWQSRNTYDLKPIKRRGRIYYLKSVLDAHLEQSLIREGRRART